MLWDEPKIFFLERRYFFSIILSEFLKNRVALQGEEWNIGDVVKIVYRGSIQETSPAVIEKESAIAVVDRAQDDQ